MTSKSQLKRLCVQKPLEMAEKLYKLEEENYILKYQLREAGLRTYDGLTTNFTILKETLELGIKIVSRSRDYLSEGVNCEKNCDPSVGFHEPLCVIVDELNGWLGKSKAALEKK